MNNKWTYKTFGEVGTFLRGKSIQKADFVEKGLPCIHYGQIHTKFGISIDKHLSEIPLEVYHKSIIASPGDLIIAITSEDLEGSCKSTAWLGDYDIAVSAHAAVYKHNLNPKFIAYYLRSNSFFTEKEKYARGFKVMEIKPTDIARIPIPVPSNDIQQTVVAELDNINELISLKKSQLNDFADLEQSIFHDMFGDLIVNDKGWEIRKLGDIAHIGDGLHGTPKYDEAGKCYFINGNNLDNGSIIITKDTKKVNEQEKEKYKIDFSKNTIFISINGSIGKVAFYNNENIILGKSACYIILNEYINKRYIYNVLKNRYFLDYVSNEYTGTTIKNVSLKSMRNLPVPLPPVSLQESFANCIMSLEQQRKNINASINNLETLLASRMQYWFD
jgi:type I restriction enzyme S subunit